LPQPSIQGHSIVLIGDFNPKIFQPMWFGVENLLRQREADGANIEIVHPEVVIFSLEWLRLEVTRERFSASTTLEAYDEVIRDLVIGTFKLLRHTPLRKLGINREMHFMIESEEKWHKIGDTLAPKVPWADLLKNPGMRALVMEEAERRDGLKGYIRVNVEPSTRIHPGVFLRINDHYEAEDQKTVVGADHMTQLLEYNWSDSYHRSKDIIHNLLKRLL
jgi:hypothetical protein